MPQAPAAEQLALEDIADVEELLEAELLEQQLAPGLADKLARFEAGLLGGFFYKHFRWARHRACVHDNMSELV